MHLVLPRHVVCLLGHWRDLGEVQAVVDGSPGFEFDRRYSQTEADPRMTEAFEASYDRVSLTVTDSERVAVDEHTAVAYVLSPPVPKERGVELSGKMLSLVEKLLRNGAVAAKSESAGLAHGRGRWLELAEEYRCGDEHASAASLYWAWVRRPLESEDGWYYSCGMHLLGEPDTQIPTSLPVEEAVKWIDMMGLYRVADRPRQLLESGQYFRLSDTSARRRIGCVYCERYDEDDFFFNPYGYCTLEEEGA